MTDQEEAKEDPIERPSFEELGKAFDTQFSAFRKIVPQLSKKSLVRVFLKSLGHPLKEDDITLVHKEEGPIYELAVNINQLQINMMIESLTKMHQEETKTMVDNLDKLDKIQEESSGEDEKK